MTEPVVLNKVRATEASLALYGIVGLDITVPAVSQALEQAKGVKRLNVYCDSPGGELFAGYSILAQLERFAKTAEVVFTVEGLCASAATIIAMGASRVVMSPISTWMVHEARAVAGGTASEHAKMAEILSAETAKLVNLYARKTGHPSDEIAALLAEEKYFNAEEAVAFGFADEVIQPDAPSLEACAPVAVTPQSRVEDAIRAQRMAAMKADALRIRSLCNAASRVAAPGQPGQPTTLQPAQEIKKS